MLSRRLIKVTAIVIVSIFTLTSCGLPPPGTPLTPEEREKAKNQCIAQYVIGGAVVGGITGALLGGLTGRRAGVGAVLGAIAGGVLAYMYAWGKCMAYFSDLNTFPVADYRTTMKNEGYDPSQGNVVRVKNVAILPGEPKSGDKAKVDGSYYIMAPREMKEVEVIETRRLYFFNPEKNEWEYIDGSETSKKVVAELGTRKADGNLDIHEKIADIKLRYEITVEALGKKDAASTDFMVKKATAKGNSYEIVLLTK